MLTQILPHRPADGRCRASARNLRTHAELLRDGAEAAVLTTGQRIMLLRDAEAAERQASRRMRALRPQRPGPNGNGRTPQGTDQSYPDKLQRSVPVPACCSRTDKAFGIQTKAPCCVHKTDRRS